MKSIEGQFMAFARKGKMVFDNAQHLEGYCIQHEGERFVVTCRQVSTMSEKQRMFNYLYGPLLDCAMKGFADMGYDGVDKVVAMYKLKADFAKGFVYNRTTKEHEPYLLDLAKMNKDRLLKFLNDCIFFLETSLSIQVPDSQEYKIMLKTGIEYKKLKESYQHKDKE